MALSADRLAAPALLEMLQRVCDAGDPWGGQFCGGRVNVFRAAVKGGWLGARTGALTEEGQRALAEWESRRQEAA